MIRRDTAGMLIMFSAALRLEGRDADVLLNVGPSRRRAEYFQRQARLLAACLFGE